MAGPPKPDLLGIAAYVVLGISFAAIAWISAKLLGWL